MKGNEAEPGHILSAGRDEIVEKVLEVERVGGESQPSEKSFRVPGEHGDTEIRRKTQPKIDNSLPLLFRCNTLD